MKRPLEWLFSGNDVRRQLAGSTHRLSNPKAAAQGPGVVRATGLWRHGWTGAPGPEQSLAAPWKAPNERPVLHGHETFGFVGLGAPFFWSGPTLLLSLRDTTPQRYAGTAADLNFAEGVAS